MTVNRILFLSCAVALPLLLSGCFGTRNITGQQYIDMPEFTATVIDVTIVPLDFGKDPLHSAAMPGVDITLEISDSDRIRLQMDYIDANWFWASRLKMLEPGKRYIFKKDKTIVDDL